MYFSGGRPISRACTVGSQNGHGIALTALDVHPSFYNSQHIAQHINTDNTTQHINSTHQHNSAQCVQMAEASGAARSLSIDSKMHCNGGKPEWPWHCTHALDVHPSFRNPQTLQHNTPPSSQQPPTHQLQRKQWLRPGQPACHGINLKACCVAKVTALEAVNNAPGALSHPPVHMWWMTWRLASAGTQCGG